MKKLWMLIIILSIGIIIILYNIYNTKKRDIHSENTFFKLYANELFGEFEKDETVAGQKYNNKIIEIHGKIGEITKSQDNDIMFILKEKNDVFGINCMIVDKDIKSNHYLVGDSITIKGIVQGYLNDVIVNNCIIIK